MKQRPRIYYTETDKALMWRILWDLDITYSACKKDCIGSNSHHRSCRSGDQILTGRKRPIADILWPLVKNPSRRDMTAADGRKTSKLHYFLYSTT